MRAARIHAWGAAPVVEEVAEPVPADGQSLLGVQAAGVGHLDLTVANGDFGRAPALPYTPGVECVGVVRHSASFPEGRRVMLRGGGPGLVSDGCWAEMVVAPDAALTPLPEGIDVAVGAVFATPATTAWVALHDVGALAADDRLIVTGAAGAVGSVVVQLALEAGPASVTGVVGRAGHADRVPEGARVVVGRGAEAAAELGPPPTLLVDTVGGSGLPALLAAVAPGGRAALVGYTAGTSVTLDLPSWLLADVTLCPVNMMRRAGRARELIGPLADRLRDGRVALAVEEVPLTDVSDAVARLRGGEVVGRLVLRP